MTENKLTPWFDGRAFKPARPGVYMLMCGHGRTVGYQKWDGKNWLSWCQTVEAADAAKSWVDERYQNDNWRGCVARPTTKRTP